MQKLKNILKKSETIKNLKVAVAHDFLVEYGGAEKVFEAIMEVFPNATAFTTEFWPEKFPEFYKSYKIQTGFVSKLPFHKKLFQHFKLFHTFIFEKFNLGGFDLIISSSAGFAKGVLTHPRVPHLAYIHTPPRFLWGLETTRHDKMNPLMKLILRPIESYWRMWDFNAAQRPFKLIANSKITQERISKFYRRDSEIIHPPVDTKKIAASEESDLKITRPFYFVVSRLVKYKKVDLIIEAFKKLPYDLYISGTGEAEKELRLISQDYPNVHLLGRASDADRNYYLKHAKASIFVGEEEFGIVMVESLAAGTPVIAFNKAGAAEIVTHKKTGVLFDEQSSSAIINAVKEAEKINFKKSDLLDQAEKFSKESFKEKLANFALKALEEKSIAYPENLSRS